MSKRQLTLELEQPLTLNTAICEHDLTTDRLTLDKLTLDQLTEWGPSIHGGVLERFVRENARSMYVLMCEILPIFDLLVEKGELPEPYISRG